MIIYYNPGCSKCQEAKGILEEQHCDIEIRDYLQDPLNEEELQALINKLGCKPFDLVRTTEPLFVEKFAGLQFSDQQWLDILAKYPILMQRPIVISGDQAVIGRPPSLVLQLLKEQGL